MQGEKILLKGELADNQLADLKSKYASLWEYRTSYGVAYFRKPDRLTLKSATDAVQQGLSEYNEVVAENTFVAGCKEILEDADYYNDLMGKVSEIAKGKTGELTKL